MADPRGFGCRRRHDLRGAFLGRFQERNWAVRPENQARIKEANAREAEKAARAAFLSEAQEREKAVAERRRAEEALLATRTAIYSNALKEADRAWLLNDLPKAIDTLDACPVEQRRREWQFLRRLYQGGILTLEGVLQSPRRCFQPGWQATGHRLQRQGCKGLGPLDRSGAPLADWPHRVGLRSSL